MISPEPTATRVGLAATLATLLSTAGHVAGGGADPGPATLALATGVALVLASLFVDREWTHGRLLVVLGCGQVAAHILFAAGTGERATHGVGMALAHAAATVAVAGLLADADRVVTGIHALLRLATQPGPRLRPCTALIVAATPIALPVSSAPQGLGGPFAALVAPRRGPPA